MMGPETTHREAFANLNSAKPPSSLTESTGWEKGAGRGWNEGGKMDGERGWAKKVLPFKTDRIDRRVSP